MTMRCRAFVCVVLLLAGSSCNSDDSDPSGGRVENSAADVSPPASQVTTEGESTAPDTAAVTSTVASSQLPDETSGLTVSRATAVGATQDEVTPGEVRLWVSNQSFDEDPVSITIRIDGEVVVNDSFSVGSQHNWMSFDIAGLSAGLHELVAASETGAQTNGSFTLPEGESRWLVADYWFDASEQDSRYFTLSESDEPVYFD